MNAITPTDSGLARPTAGDLVAGISVAVVLIPQSLAYALLAGLPPETGIYASIAPIILYAIFGTSRALARPIAADHHLGCSGYGFRTN